MRLHTVVAVTFAVVLLAPATAFAAADVAITFGDTPDPLPEEAQVDYNLTVTNNGPDPATGVQVTVPAPPSTLFSFVSASLSQGSVSLGAGNTVLYTMGTIASGNSATGTSRWSGDHPGTGGSTASLTATSADPDTSNNSASVSTTVVGLTAGDASFGDQALGTIGPAKPILVTNGSSQSVTLPASLPVSGEPDDFLGMRGCGGLTLAAGASCTLTARFAPSLLGDRTAVVTVDPTAGPVDPFGLNLSGRGVAPPLIGGPTGPPGPPGPQGPPAFKLIVVPVSATLRAPAGKAVRFAYVSTLNARVRLVVLKRSKRVASVTGRARTGANRLRWNGRAGRRAARAGRYTLRLTAVNGDQTARATAKLTLTKR